MCHLCHKKTKVPLKKPEKPDEFKAEEIITEKVKKKKKKKKDLCAGLNPKVIAQVASTSDIKIQQISNACLKSPNKPYQLVIHKSNQKQMSSDKNVSFKKNNGISNQSKGKLKKIMNSIKAVSTTSQPKSSKKSLLSSFLDSL